MNTASALRRALFAVLVFGLLGTATELVLIEHYEDTLQIIPLVLVAAAAGIALWHGVSNSAASVRALQAAMAVFIVGGCVGAALHYRGGAEFQREIDPAQSGWQIFAKVMRAKAPPVLASGIMVQLGLMGLVYAYRHPALDGFEPRSSSMEPGQ
jgi:hypothetical protein